MKYTLLIFTSIFGITHTIFAAMPMNTPIKSSMTQQSMDITPNQQIQFSFGNKYVTIEDITSYGLNNLTTFGITYNRELIGTPLFLRIQMNHGFSYTSGSAIITGEDFDGTTINGDISKNKHYTSQETRRTSLCHTRTS